MGFVGFLPEAAEKGCSGPGFPFRAGAIQLLGSERSVGEHYYSALVQGPPF